MSRSRGGLFKLGFQGIGFYCLGIRLGGMLFTNDVYLFYLSLWLRHFTSGKALNVAQRFL